MARKTKVFDPADYLKDEEAATEFLRLSLETNDPRDIVHSLSIVARARGGIEKLAEQTGLPFDLLQDSLSETGNPDLATLLRILQGLGIKLAPANASEPAVAA
jgi:probable addiction module antidote protein